MSDAHVNGPSAPRQLRCEYLTDPIGIDEPEPRLSWQVVDPRRGAVQSAYRVQVASTPALLAQGQADVWDSGRVEGASNVGIAYAGPALASRQRCWWQVRTWDGRGAASPRSAPASFEMGLLAPADWSAEWVGTPPQKTTPAPAYLRAGFELAKPVRRARAYATALGVYELRLNGARVGDQLLAPGWTEYRKRVTYQTYDVTGRLRQGANVAGVIVGDGWYCGRLGWGEKPEAGLFGARPPRFLLQLEVEFEDGPTQRLVTDGSWRWRTGAILSSDYYDGESYDARKEPAGWDAPGAEAKGWKKVQVFEDPGMLRCAQMDPPIRVTQELTPLSVRKVGRGYVFDLGQNMVGVARLRASGERGKRVRLRFAEVLQPNGAIYTENLRGAKATDTYVLKGEGVETFTPRFTYHGFRYVELRGFPGEPDLNAVTGLVLHTDCAPTATLRTSSSLVNRLFANITWGQRGNMHSVLTDCPQRDERLGWMGDAQVFARTACTNMDMAAMLTKFSRDMMDEQTEAGAFPDVCPYVSPKGLLPPAGAPAWMDAGVIVPWTVYLCYGDSRILERHFASMARYVDYLTANNPGGIWENARGNDYGDWVPAGEKTDKTMFATLHYFLSATLVAKAARALGRDADAQKQQAVADRVRNAFNARYLKGGAYENATQTVDALALAFGVVPESARKSVAENLVRNIESRGGHLSTGFGGTQWLLPALCETGHADLARRLLLNRDFPSWGYMIGKGATAVWELWNSDTEGPGMNSRNHFAYGSVGEWLFRYLAGIDTAEDGPGYGHIVVRPFPGCPEGELNQVTATYESIRGRIISAWRVLPSALEICLDVPANCRATVHIPADSAGVVTEMGRPLAQAHGVSKVRVEAGRVVCEVGAGSYSFSVVR
jgi:alpha-L-rhamnosidase